MANPDQPLPLDQLYYEMRDRKSVQDALTDVRKELTPLRSRVEPLEKKEKELLAEIERRDATIRRLAKQI